MDKMKFETPNLTAENLAKIAELFPGVVTEGKVNIDLLRTMLGEDVFGDEAYEFTWVGKRAAIAEAGRPIRKTLRPCVEESKNWDTTENLYIEGDNLDVLKLLQESYLGKVKMVYIDPPYNTGKDNFVYRDKFSMDEDEYDDAVEMHDENGLKNFQENSVTNPRFHSAWCTSIYPTLVLARNLLSNDGVIFISIDDGEVAQLRKICDEVFGAENFIAQFIWEKRVTRENRKIISVRHDYILCYTKRYDLRDLAIGLMPMTDEAVERYNNPDNDPRGVWTSVPAIAQAGHGTVNQFYTLTTPSGRKVDPPSGSCWRYTRDRMEEAIKDNRIWFGSDGNGVPRIKKFITEGKQGLTPETMWLSSSAGTNDSAKRDLVSLFEGIAVFETPKPVQLLKQCLQISTNEDAICMDFYSGTSPLAHAVMQLNSEDGGKRKFIMVQLPEICAEGTEAAKAGYKNICEIGKERIRRAGEKIKAEAGLTAQNLDIGFRVLKLDDTNMNDVYYAAGDYTQDMISMLESNIKENRTDMDLLFGCLLDWGLPLSLPHTHEEIEGFTVHTYNEGDLIACFEERISENVVREIAKRQPLRVVFRDSSFTSSPEKINVVEIFKLLAPNTTVRVI